ncbi:MAG: hypothetical protein ACLGIK_02325 [Gemmatimonadota bacterium]
MQPLIIARKSWRRILAAAFLGVAAACGTADGAVTGPVEGGNPGGGDPGGQRGIVSGRVVDAKGQPIAGATIVINNAVWFNKNIVLTSGADGTYRYSMPATDSWYVRGTTRVDYNGRTYTLDLHPDYAGAFSGAEGRVVNLQWKMTGEVPRDFGHDGYYGGSVEMDAGWDMSDLAGVTLTLTPVGTLIDGSIGQTITRTIAGTVGSFAVRDVPLGRYTVRATRNGTPLLIQMRHTTTYAQSVTTDFEPAYQGATAYGIYFRVATAE